MGSTQESLGFAAMPPPSSWLYFFFFLKNFSLAPSSLFQVQVHFTTWRLFVYYLKKRIVCLNKTRVPVLACGQGRQGVKPSTACPASAGFMLLATYLLNLKHTASVNPSACTNAPNSPTGFDTFSCLHGRGFIIFI
jgi:hypothetical protein